MSRGLTPCAALYRDYLWAHADARDEYGRLKQALAKQHPHDIDAYIDGKSGFIEAIIKRAREVSPYGADTEHF